VVKQSLLVAAAVALLSAPLLAQGAAAPPEGPVATGVAPPTTLRAVGTISSYDGDLRVLALTTQTGVVRFPLGTAAHVHLDGHQVETGRLTGLTGYRAAVRYSEVGGRRTVRSVNVFDNRERTPR
jgi:hypothetical protein